MNTFPILDCPAREPVGAESQPEDPADRDGHGVHRQDDAQHQEAQPRPALQGIGTTKNYSTIFFSKHND